MASDAADALAKTYARNKKLLSLRSITNGLQVFDHRGGRRGLRLDPDIIGEAKPTAARSAACTCLLLAQSGHSFLHRTCPLSVVKRTSPFALHMSAFDPKRTYK